MKKRIIIPVAVVAGAVAARMIQKRRKKKAGGYRSGNVGSPSASTSHTANRPDHSARRSRRRSRAGE